MRSLSVRLLLLSFLILVLVPAAFAHDVTITGTTSFAALDGSSSDHDGSANGVFTVSDGNLVVNGVVNCNDDSTESACSMAFNVSGNMTVGTGGALYAENRTGSGTGGTIALTVGGNLALTGNAIISTSSKSSSGAVGGNITASVNGGVSLASGTTIDAGSSNAKGGAIAISAGGAVSVEGNVISGPSRTFLATRLGGGAALDGGTGNSAGGAITIRSTSFTGPAVVVGTNANIVSQGSDNGAGPITIEGCGVQVRGLIAALSRKDGVANIRIRSGKDVLIDGRDLGGSGTRMGRVRAHAPTGTAINKGVDVFATGDINAYGPANTSFVISSLPGPHDAKSYGGLIRITSLGGAVNASGNVIEDGHTATGDTGGTIEIAAKEDVNLNTAVIRAVGDFSSSNPNRGGGSIRVRSYSGDVIWTNGTGEVRPVGSTSSLPLADQGSIVLTACGTVDTTGSSFPVMGTATSVFPETHTGVCSPAAPSLPAGVPALIVCNTPPVANDATVTTNEDTTVTITLSGTDADGDPLTFSIVSGPSNGVLGPIVPTGPTSATVNYSPNANYFGADSFVYQANDGNGGTDNATVTITVNAVNDPPSFLAGPTVTVLEDSGPYTYPNWASSISAGPANESGQTVTFTVTASDPTLFSVQPAVSSGGTLTFTPAANANGTSSITVTAHDNGGTANGGSDSSAPQSSSITITAVNDEPSFTSGGDVTVNEDSGAYSATWATAISAGPNESGQTLTFVVSNDNHGLFSVQPSISSTGVLTFTPAPNASGFATVSVYLQDNGGTANGGDDTSGTVTFKISVTAVNDAPTANADSWETEGNTELRVDLAAGLTPSVQDSTPSGKGVIDNDSDPEGDPITITGVVGCADVVTPYVCAVTGGTVTLNANGSFSFQPSAGATSGSFQYTISDGGASANGTVSITIHDMIWYVNGSAASGGNGTSASPFTDFASLNGPGGVGDVDGAGDYIFVHTSAVTGGLGLEASQKLWGQRVGLIIPRNLNGNGSPTTLVAAGVAPTITATFGDVIVIDKVTNTEVAGVSLASSTGTGIDVISSGSGSASASIYSNTITTGVKGIDVAANGTGSTTVNVNDTAVTAMSNGVAVSANAGTVTFSYTNGSVTSLNANGILVDARNNAVVSAVTVTGTTFSSCPGQAVIVQAANTSTITMATISGNTFNNNGLGINVTQSHSANVSFRILNNTTILGSQLHGINVFSSATSTGGTLTGRIQGNVVGNTAVAGSGSAFGNGIRVVVQGQTRGIMLIDANVVRQVPFGRGIEVTGQSSPGLDVTITNNDVNPQDASGFPSAAIFVTSDDLGTGGLVRADIRNNTVPSPSDTYDYPNFDGTGAYLVFEEFNGAVSQLVDTPPASATASAQLAGANTGSTYANAGVSLIAGPIMTPP